MAKENPVYKLSLTGGDITVKNREISESVARQILNLLLGGAMQEAPIGAPAANGQPAANNAPGETPSAKSFMAMKKPASDVEKITCLAYYLANYRSTPAFKTRDLTKLNLEAAQTGFTNATMAARNAETAGYLAKAGGGSKQISVPGEALVKALPDREKVKIALAEAGARRKRRAKKSKTGK